MTLAMYAGLTVRRAPFAIQRSGSRELAVVGEAGCGKDWGPLSEEVREVKSAHLGLVYNVRRLCAPSRWTWGHSPKPWCPVSQMPPVILGLNCAFPESWQFLSCPVRQRLASGFLVLSAPEAGVFLAVLVLG